MSFYFASLEKKEQIATGTYAFTFAFEQGTEFQFKPGQYVWLTLLSLQFPDPHGAQRAFSIASSNEHSTSIQVIMGISESGYKKTIANLAVGARVKISSPFGSSYVVQESNDERIVIIAGGMAIAPFLSLLRSPQALVGRKIEILYCNTSPKTACFLDEITQIASRTGIQCTLHYGKFDKHALSSTIDYPNDTFYICGSQGFVDQVYQDLSDNGAIFPHMHFEQHYPTPAQTLTEEDFSLRSRNGDVMVHAIHESKNHVIITDVNGHIIFANKVAEKNTGYTFDEMRGNTPRLWGGLMSTTFYKELWKTKHLSGGYDGEIINRRKSGEIYHVIAHISPILAQNQEVIGYIGTEEDISEQVKLNKQLQSQKEQIAQEQAKDEALLANIGDGLLFTDTADVVIRTNPAFERLFGLQSDSIIGKKAQDILLRNDHGPTDGPVEYIRPDGTHFFASSIRTPIFIDSKESGFVEVFRDVTKEREIDKAKSEFVSIASHQLRTPLGINKWYLEALKEDAYIKNAPDDTRTSIDQIYASNERLLALVRDLLSVSRIDQQRIKDNPQDTDVIALVKSLVQEMNVLATMQQVSLTFDVRAQTVPRMYVDPLRLHEVVGNLLSNALEFTPAKGSIHVSLDVVENAVQIAVKDTGIGISSEDQKKLFQKFVRTKKATAVNPNGSGLGLYLVKSYVEEWGGSVTIDSKEGEGATFCIILPLKDSS